MSADGADRHPAILDSSVRKLEALAFEALATCRGDLMTARQNLLSTRSVEGIHRTRVALRRIRAAATLFGRALRDDRFLGLRDKAKQLADACGATRDLDVFLSGVLKEAERQFAHQPQVSAQLEDFRRAGVRLRRSRHDAARHELGGEVFTTFDVRLTALLTSLPDRVPATRPSPARETSGSASSSKSIDAATFARSLLRQRDRKLRRKIERLAKLDESQRHALRLRVKRQRYSASFLAPLFAGAASSYLKAATELQDALGLANDRSVAVQVVDEIRGSAHRKGRLDWCSGVLTGWLAAGAGQDDRDLSLASRHFAKAPRFWRHETHCDSNESIQAKPSAASDRTSARLPLTHPRTARIKQT